MPSVVTSIVALCVGWKPSWVSEKLEGPPLGISNWNDPSAATVVETLGCSATATVAPVRLRFALFVPREEGRCEA